MKLGLIKQKIANFLNDESGASGIEYALIAAMVAVVIATLGDDISTAVKEIFQGISDALTPTP